MTDASAVRWITVAFALLALVHIRVHGPRVFFIGEGDDESYFAYARTIVADRDLDFSNEPVSTFRSAQNPALQAARYAVGPGLLWIPFYIVGAGFSRFMPGGAEVSDAIWLSLAAGSMIFGYAGYLLLFFTLRRFVPTLPAFWAVMAVGFSSPLLYYLFRRPLMSHAAEWLALNTALYAVTRLREETTTVHAAAAGAVTGFLFLCRWTAAPYVAGLGALGFWLLRRRERSILRLTGRQFAFAAALAAVGSVQLLVWHHLTGSFYPGEKMFDLGIVNRSVLFSVFPWTGRHLIDLWVGLDWGIVWLSPAIVLAIAGLFVRAKGSLERLVKGLLMVTGASTFLIAANWPSHGGDYGNRYLLAAWALFAFGFASGLDALESVRRGAIRKMAIGAALVGFFASQGLLLLFKSNADTLTLAPGPTRYRLPSDWVNHRYAAEAWRTIASQPHRVVLTLGASVPGYLTYRAVYRAGKASALPAGLSAYYAKRDGPSAQALGLLLLLLSAGVLGTGALVAERMQGRSA